MGVQQVSTLREHKTPAELEWVGAELVLAKSPGLGTLARSGVVTAQQVKDVGLFQFQRVVGLPLLIDQERKRDAGLFAENAGKVHVPHADSGQAGALSAESGFVFAQLRDVFAAKDSTIVPQQHQHRRTLLPKHAQPE